MNGNDKKSLNLSDVDLVFSFAPNGAGAVAASSIQGEGIESVTRTGVGAFDIVLKRKWYAVRGFVPSIQLNADADTTISSWNYTAATKTLSIRTRTAGAAADIAAHASNRLGGTITVRNSGVGK